MADDWPFLHLNVISPPIERLGSDGNQELSLSPFDSSHLEAWTNINFRFDQEPAVIYNNNSTTTTSSNSSADHVHKSPNNSSTRHIRLSSSSSSSKNTSSSNHELFPSSPELSSFRLSDDPRVSVSTATKFLDPSSNLVSTTSDSSNSFNLDRLSRSNRSIICSDQLTDNHSNNAIIHPSSIDPHHPPNSNSKVDDHSSLFPQDHASPTTNNQQIQHNSHGKDDDDEANRIAHDEDKRRRNTLASARFRMKKKMKEQEIERTAKEMRERVSELEREVDSLKQENKWLRGLIVDSTASKLVSAQAQHQQQDKIESSYLDSNQESFNKRPRSLISSITDSIHVPSHYQKRTKLTTTTTACTSSGNPIASRSNLNSSSSSF